MTCITQVFPSKNLSALAHTIYIFIHTLHTHTHTTMTVKSNETERAVAKRVEIVFRDFSSFSLKDQREHEV